MRHYNPVQTTDKDVPYVSLSDKEREQTNRAYRKFMRRRGLPLSISYPKWEKE
jgi:hypothetical protein